MTVRMEVLNSPVEPEFVGAQVQGWVGQASFSPAQAGGVADLLVRLPDLPDQFALVEETPEGEAFFCVSLRQEAMSEANGGRNAWRWSGMPREVVSTANANWACCDLWPPLGPA